MIYVSTGGYNDDYINTFEKFLNAGITNVEFSGGKFNDNHISYLKKISKNDINISLHNYAIPPVKPFVLNLSSSNNEIRKKSVDHIKKCIYVSSLINSNFYSFHAGFRLDPKPSTLGKEMNFNILLSFERALQNFNEASKEIIKFAKKYKIQIFIENNVINFKNFKKFGENPFLFTGGKYSNEFMSSLDEYYGILIDTGHLNVSSKTLQFDKNSFIEQIAKKRKIAFHLSENNSFEDENSIFDMNAWFIKYLNIPFSFASIEVYNEKLSKLFDLQNKLEKYI